MYMNLVTDVTNTNYCYNAEIDNGRESLWKPR